MPKKLGVYTYVFLLCAICGNLWGQDINPTSISDKILPGETYTFTFTTNDPIQVVSGPTDAGSVEILDDENSEGLYSIFSFTANEDFTGSADFIIEQTEFINRSSKQYTYLSLQVVPSLIEAHLDYVVSYGEEVRIGVLDNDDEGQGTSVISSVELLSSGSAAIDGNEIVYLPSNTDFGLHSFHYTIEDEGGHSSTGTITVNVLDGPLSGGTTIKETIVSGQDILLPLDKDNYSLQAGTMVDGGSLSFTLSGAIRYSSHPAFEGTSSFTLLSDEGKEILVEIVVIDNELANDFVIDDEVFTSVDNPVIFDVFENDLRTDGTILDYSSELTLLPDNKFSYDPPTGFSGVKEFTYTVFDGSQELVGTIEIYIGNYLPQREQYSFVTKQATPLAIQYNAPIRDYEWSIVSGPDQGFVSVGLGGFAQPNCDAISGFEMAVYQPNNDWVGDDSFVLEYCVSNGTCKQVEVLVTTQASDESCHCYGSDCVWAGDADNNGKVSVADLLAIGYNYGESGSVRSIEGIDWCANYADDWLFDQVGNTTNNKYVDGNGDGIINVEDTVGISENHSRHHNITAQEVLSEKNDVLHLTPSASSLGAGQTLTIEVQLGDEQSPVLDRQGIAFSLRLPSNVDPNSVIWESNNDWIGNGSPVLTMSNFDDGIIEVGIVRTEDRGISGFGLLGKLQITGEEDMDGFRPEGDEIPVEIEVDEAFVTDGSGKKFKVKGEALELIYKLNSVESENAELTPEISISPNPAYDRINLVAAGGDEILDVTIFSMTGQAVYQKVNVLSPSHSIEHALPEGMYIATIKTNRGITSKKLQIIR